MKGWKDPSSYRRGSNKMNATIGFCIFELVEIPNFSLNFQFWFFGPSLLTKGVMPVKNGKREHHHWILNIRTSLGTKIQLKLTVLIFYWPNLPKKGISSQKQKNRTCMYIPGCYVIYQTFMNGGWQTHQYFNVSSPSSHRDNYFGRCSSELAQLVPLPYSWGRSNHYSERLHDFSVTISSCYIDVYVNSFFPPTARLWNSLPIECFALTYDLSAFKPRIKRHLLTAGSF